MGVGIAQGGGVCYNKNRLKEKGCAMMKKISTYARQDIEKFLDARVNLKVWVKVRKEWRDNALLLKDLGYKNLK